MADGVWTFELCDQDDTLLDDVTHLVTNATISPRLNQPYSHVLTCPADSDVWKTAAGDGLRALTEGVRTIKAKRNGVLIANPEIWRLDYSGDENTQQVQISCFDSMTRLLCRNVRDSVGRVADWIFPDSISAGDLVQQLFQNSVTYDDAVPYGTTRAFPIDCSNGTFTAATDVAEELTDGPTTLAYLIYQVLCKTGVADVMLAPTDTDAGSAPGITGIVNCVDGWGSDLTGTVHFDYDTGDNNVKAFQRSFDMSLVTNWLRYLLAPKISNDHWRGSLEAVDPALLAISTMWRDAEAASRLKYGSLPTYESNDSDANNARALWRAIWKAESTLRVNPRQLLNFTPSADCEFAPFADYGMGDRVAVNMSDNTGPALSGAVQRIYGQDITVDVNGVEDPGQLILSPDGAAS